MHSPEATPAERPHSRPIILARTGPLRLGPLTVDPAGRRIAHPDGREEFLEPRVMQVLVALIQARGAILSRDELIECCWCGRIVGEDAITRVMSRLRRLSFSIGQGIFSVETLTKVGYRLVWDAAGWTGQSSSSLGARPPIPDATRRGFILAGAATATFAGAGGGALLYRHFSRTPANREAELLMALAFQAWGQGTADGNFQAIGLYRRAVDTAPDYADAWGFLGCAYADRSHSWARAAERESFRGRARAAGQRALMLDPKNAYGRGAIAYARPLMGNWLAMEREFRRAIEDQPHKWCMTYSLALAYVRVGRFTEAAALFEQVRSVAPAATQYYFQALSLWGAGRLDEADRLTEEAAAIYATNPLIWSGRFNLLLFSGRASAAIALAQDADVRPAGLADSVIDERLTVARAVETRNPAHVSAAMTAQVARAREAAGAASYAIQVASALGLVDDAFALAEAYFFSRGFIIPDEKVPAGQVPAVTLDERATGFLFLPSTRSVRTDPRFPRLVRDLGLERYWQQSGAQPDFRRSSLA